VNPVAAVAALLLVGGCAHATEDPDARPHLSSDIARAHVTAVHVVGPDKVRMYAVGTDVVPGTYVARSGDACGSFAATSAGFQLGSDDDGFLRGSVQVGPLQRIVVHRGEFLGVICGEWRIQDAATTTADPATRAGACAILVGPHDLVGAALEVTDRSSANEEETARLQDELMAVVEARTRGLDAAAGQLVDYLDDPSGYYQDGELAAEVARARDRIHALCGR
jgi:hypothetical protein